MDNNFKNIIFDFGGVIIRIEYLRIAAAYKSFGVDNFDQLYSKLHQTTLFDDFEKGLISPQQFRDQLRQISGINLIDSQIDEGWNAILIDLPKENIEVLKRLKESHRLFLLSNTNAIHEKAFTEIIFRDYGKNILEDVFDKIYFSHHLHMRKPDLEIFERVLTDNNLKAGETLFVDDSMQHIDGAKKAGLQTMFVENGKMIADLF
ncbi:MAG: HAD family phosphatase [Bacteroidota bacterium]